jgi:hypothetical protein
MKTGDRRPFWSLSPTVVARRLELLCWLAAASLVLALALAPARSMNASAGPSLGVPAERVSILILQRKCIDKILSQARDMSEEAAVQQINQQCLAARLAGPSPAARSARLACERPVAVHVTPAFSRVGGCLRG